MKKFVIAAGFIFFAALFYYISFRFTHALAPSFLFPVLSVAAILFFSGLLYYLLSKRRKM